MKKAISFTLIVAALATGCTKQIAERAANHPNTNATPQGPQLGSIVVVDAPPTYYGNIDFTNPYQNLGGPGQQGNGYSTNLETVETGSGYVSNGGSNWIGQGLGWPNGWWENEAWLDANFSLTAGPVNTAANLPKLTLEEKLLVAQYPVAAYLIYLNKSVAENETMAMLNRNGNNDISDAFRHAYFQAINTRDVGDHLTLLFSTAHESEVPAQLQKEKQMDLFNNLVGIAIGQQQYGATNASLSAAVSSAITNGQLRYLNPINLADPNFFFTHGITAQTQLVPTP